MRLASSTLALALALAVGPAGCGSRGGAEPDTTRADCAAFLEYTRESFRSVEVAVPQRERLAPDDASSAAAVQSRIADALEAVANAPARFTSPTVGELERRHKASYAARARALRRANEGLLGGDPSAVDEARTMDRQADADLASVLRDFELQCAKATEASASSSPAPSAQP